MDKRNWNNITLKDWYEIQNILSVEDEYTTFNLLDYLYGIDSTNMPLVEVYKYTNALSFLNNTEAYKTIQLEDKYTINGTTYVGFTDITKISVGQFIDYKNYTKENPIKYEDVLSVFIIPEGHNYNDGYDMGKVKEDMLELPFIVCQKCAFFLLKQLETFAQIFLFYSMKEIEKMKGIDKEKKKEVIEQMEKMVLLHSELSHTY